MEEWRTAIQNDNYEVSSFGRVRRKGKRDCLKINYNSTGGYGRVSIGKVHTVVAYAFIGDRPKGLDINHIDGNKRNNHVSNLEYVTRSENCRKACNEQGLRNMKGEKHNKTRLSPANIMDIKRRLLEGSEKQKDIAKEYGVHPTTIAQIKRRKDGYYGSI